jgi:hypothetical protein
MWIMITKVKEFWNIYENSHTQHWKEKYLELIQKLWSGYQDISVKDGILMYYISIIA